MNNLLNQGLEFYSKPSIEVVELLTFDTLLFEGSFGFPDGSDEGEFEI